MRSTWLTVLGMATAAAFGCSALSSCTSDQPSTRAAAEAQPVASSSYLRTVLAPSWLGPVVVPTAEGAVVAGGVEEVSYDEAESVPHFRTRSEAAIVRADGTVTMTEPMEAPLVNTAGTAVGGSVFVVGMSCATGTGPTPAEEVRCDHASVPALARLDVRAGTWSTLTLPDEAPRPIGVVGDQRVIAVDEQTLLYTVQDELADELSAWLTVDGAKTWRPTEAPAGTVCAVGDDLIDIADPRGATEPRTPVTSEDAPVPFRPSVRHLDIGRAAWGDPSSEPPGDLMVVRGAAIWACTPAAGVVALTVDGDGRSVIVGFDGSVWTVFVDQDRLTLSGAVPTAGSELVVAVTGRSPTTFDTSSQVLGGAIDTSDQALLITGVGTGHILVREGEDLRVVTIG